eukprot:CAMPEP_0171077270 /NCGR_PEP_ID=MMETSP0766_2-20121228/13923_1 /TAXON_ID=439317 /ORGANISM="Gambierdiscus australes, Strain CAWD 149" /LENGTH=848 /DNA_ID=CAMNT_0011534313 /DNA_START=180 /DNA_END=2723 /DNA_ORIENTATION=+
MLVKIGSTAPGFENWSIELDVEGDTTVGKLKALLAAPPHGLEITPKSKVLWKRAQNCLMGLHDTEKVRGSLVLLNVTPAVKEMKFPDTFLWGAATAAYQIEGAAMEGGRAPSIWDTFAEVPGNVADGNTGATACDHYHKFREDVKLMKRIGLPAYRFSISWSRLLPSGRGRPNSEAVQFYRDLLDELIAHKITPMVTLYHWDLPQCLEDEYRGWLGKQVVDDFEYYAAVCFEKFGDRVRHWCTLNEPWCMAVLGYASGEHAPGRKEAALTEPYIAAHHMILAHAKAVKRYRTDFRAKQQGRLGMVLNMDWKEPLSQSPTDVAAQRRALDWQVGWFADPIYKGQYPTPMRVRCGDRLPIFTDEEKKMIKGSADFFGLNHYSTDYVSADPHREPRSYFEDQEVKNHADPSWLKTDIGWDVVPWGLGRLVCWIQQEYSPVGGIIITENGCAVDDEDGDAIEDTARVEYFQQYLSQLHKAINNGGADVRGYFAWSFMDNFEWAYGFAKRFGLVRVNYQTQERTVKASGHFFAQVARENTVRLRTKLAEEAEYAPFGTREPAAVPQKKEPKKEQSPDPKLSPEDATRMLQELARAYLDTAFQTDMEKVYTRSMEGGSLSELSKQRQALCLTIQSTVLPKYGFAASTAGAVRSSLFIQTEMKAHEEVLNYSAFTNFLANDLPQLRARYQARLRDQENLAEALGGANTSVPQEAPPQPGTGSEEAALSVKEAIHLLDELNLTTQAKHVQEEFFWAYLQVKHGEEKEGWERHSRVKRSVEVEALSRCGLLSTFGNRDDLLPLLSRPELLCNDKVYHAFQTLMFLLHKLPTVQAEDILMGAQAHAAQHPLEWQNVGW